VTPGKVKAKALFVWLRRLLEPRLILNRKVLIVLVVGGLVAGCFTFARIRDQAQRALENERARLEQSDLVPFEKTPQPSLASKELAIWQAFRNSRSVDRFREHYFVATDGGLVEFDTAGNLLRHYTVLDGLPESDLLSLRTMGSQLFIGTRTQGLVAFDGQRFESYRFTDRAVQGINCMWEGGNRLLLGTAAGGLIEFDGRSFREIRAGAERHRLIGINHLSQKGARLFVGTFADGLWVREGARWSQYTLANGLLSNRVVEVVAEGENLFVASDYGLTVAPFNVLTATNQPSNSFRPVAVLPSLSGMIESGGGVLLCKDDGEVFTFSAADDPAHVQVSRVSWNQPEGMEGARFAGLGQELWLLSSAGLHRLQTDGLAVSRRPTSLPFTPFGNLNSSPFLTTNMISALTLDPSGRIWAGSFRNGLDLLAGGGRRISHLESDGLREINSLVTDRDRRSVLVATSQGLWRLSNDLRAVDQWSTRDGLLSNSVLQVGLTKTDTGEPNSENPKPMIACATSKGLSLGVPGKLHGLTTVQGLPSNSLYTLVVQGRNIYAGTLNGLALIEDGRVARVFRDTNSNLTPNWVTALCLAGSRLFLGTYGGGIFELTPAGELHGFAPETGRAVINPNAMWTDGARLYAGTLDGVLVFDLQSQKWARITKELPSRTVLSITGDEAHVYFGTTGGIARIARSYWNQPS